MQLVLMRHGKAENGQMGDHDRALAPRGILNTVAQATEFRPAAGDGMIVSDALRTRQTADALFSAWSDLGEADLPNRRDTPQGYLAPANQWLDLIAMETTSKRLWIIGHNPGISALVTELTGDYIGMTTADIVTIDLAIDQWSDIRPGSGSIVRHRPGRGA